MEAIIRLLFFLLWCCSATAVKCELKRNFSSNFAGKKTIIEGFFYDSIKFNSPTIKVINYGFFIGSKSIKSYSGRLINGKCKFELEIESPVFVQFNGVILNLSAYNIFSKWFFVDGIFLEPGDSIAVTISKDTNMVFLPVLTYSGNGANKMLCQQQVFRNTNSFRNPFDKKHLRDIKLRDSILQMIVNTIKTYDLTNNARNIITANLINTLLPDISEVILGNDEIGEMNLKDRATKECFISELEKLERVINFQDPILKFSNLEIFKQGAYRKRILLDSYFNHNIPYSSHIDIHTVDRILSSGKKGPLQERVLAHIIDQLIQHEVSKVKLDSLVLKFSDLYGKENDYVINFHSQLNLLDSIQHDRGKYLSEYLTDFEGNKYRISDFKNRVVLINFTIRGCIPCIEAIPYVTKVISKFPNSDIKVLTVYIDKNKTTYSEVFFHYKDLKSTILRTYPMGMEHPMLNGLKISSFPTYILFIKNKKLVFKCRNPRLDNGVEMIKILNEALNK